VTSIPRCYRWRWVASPSDWPIVSRMVVRSQTLSSVYIQPTAGRSCHSACADPASSSPAIVRPACCRNLASQSSVARRSETPARTRPDVRHCSILSFYNEPVAVRREIASCCATGSMMIIDEEPSSPNPNARRRFRRFMTGTTAMPVRTAVPLPCWAPSFPSSSRALLILCRTSRRRATVAINPLVGVTSSRCISCVWLFSASSRR